MSTPPIFAVADGMGGHAAGDVASALAIGEIGQLAVSDAIAAPSILASLRSANDVIRLRAATDGRADGMGTTLTGLAITTEGERHGLLVFNVGDSRTYQYRASQLTQVTVDHSLVNELVEYGEISVDEARTDPRRNVVTRALGMDTEVQIDSWLLSPAEGDRYLICSDGLTNEVGEAELLGLLASLASPQEIADDLVGLALNAGGRDNVSVVVVEIKRVAGDPSAMNEDTNPRLRDRADPDDTAPVLHANGSQRTADFCDADLDGDEV